jgi:hypothetical protein
MKRKVILSVLATLVMSSATEVVMAQTIQEILEERRQQSAKIARRTQSMTPTSVRAAERTPTQSQLDEKLKKENPSEYALSKNGVKNGNFDLYVADNGIPKISETSPYAAAIKEEAKKPKVKTLIINDNGLPVPIELTIGEFEFLQAKKESISQYLYENYELKEVRDLLREYHREQSFDKLMDKEIPLSSEEITELRVAKENEQIALNTRLRPINNHIRTTDINVESPIPVSIFVSKGLASSLVFFDSTGEPWPVEGDVIGDSSAYESNIMNSKNVVTFNILKEFTETNALITLEGMSTPLVFKLVSNGKDNDDRLSARMQTPGPNAKVTLYMDQQFENKDPYMVELMNNSFTEQGDQYRLKGISGKVFINGNKMYVKTFEKLVSPAWMGEMKSSTGYNLYELKPTSKLLFNVDGRIVQVKVEGIDFFTVKQLDNPFKN